MDAPLARTERLLRLSAPALIGLGLAAFLHVSSRLAPSPMTPLAVAVILVQVYVISELCRALFAALDRRLGWSRGIGLRLAAQLALGVVVAIAYAVAVYVPLKLWLIGRGEQDAIGWLHLALIGLTALGVALLLGLAQFSLRFFAHWRESAMAAESAQRERLQAQLEALQAQVNPHFLFNSLNALYATIEENPARAQALVLKLAELFRYVLRHGDTPLVSLGAELALLDAYLDLLRARHGEAIEMEIAVGEDIERVGLPPLSLQLLVENAVKHNAFDESEPLRLRIVRDGDRLEVSHPRRPRRQAASGTGRGLANLHRRIALLDPRPVEVVEDATRFSVSLPLVPNPA